MAILDGPLFGDEARGTVAQTLTFKRSAVHPVACAFTDHPVNWTPAKISQARSWKILCDLWRSLPDPDRASWSDIAPGGLTGFNYFMQLKGVYPTPTFDTWQLFGYDYSGSRWVQINVNSLGVFSVSFS